MHSDSGYAASSHVRTLNLEKSWAWKNSHRLDYWITLPRSVTRAAPISGTPCLTSSSLPPDRSPGQALCAVISGAEGWEDMEEYGQAQADWFEQFLDLPHGIPSPDTCRRVLSRLKPEELTQCFINWTDSLRGSLAREIVAIDGKTLRRSFDRAAAKGAVHMISAWASANRLVSGQLKVDDKSNEITAIPHLPGLLELDGATVTIDAMGCQKEIARSIAGQGADYVLALKACPGLDPGTTKRRSMARLGSFSTRSRRPG